MRHIGRPDSKFLKVACAKCKNEQIIFNKPGRDVHCLVCNSKLAEATGGKGRVMSKVLNVMD
jgi:small subunit ribosomal protein S27e